ASSKSCPRLRTTTSSSRASSTSRPSTRTRSWPSGTARSASCARSSTAAGTARSDTPSSGTGCGPPEAVLFAPHETADVRAVEEDDTRRGEAPERDHGPRVAEEPGPEDERHRRDHRRDRSVPRQREQEEPDPGGGAADERCDAEERAARGRDHLPAAAESEEQRPPVPEHRRRAGEDACTVAGELDGDERRHEALRRIEQHRRNAEAAPVQAPDVRRTDVAAALGANVLAAEDAHEPVAPRHGADDVPGHGETDGQH